MIINGTYTSVWDNETAVTTNCKINLETKEVTDIINSDVAINGILTVEYVEFNGKRYEVSNNGDTEFWYN